MCGHSEAEASGIHGHRSAGVNGNKDVDGVIKLREAISRAEAAAPTNEGKANLVALLTSGRWEWYASANFTGTVYHVTFAPDNTCTIQPGKQFLTKWEALSSRQVRIGAVSGNYYVFDVTYGKKVGVNNPERQHAEGTKSMRLERK
jgi:hypothetical protein